MIHFNFKLSDTDAENLFGCITTEINQCNDSILDILVKSHNCNDTSDIEMYKDLITAEKARIKYLNTLKLKLLNKAI